MKTKENQQRQARTDLAGIYLDWATRSSEKAYDTTDPHARVFYRQNAIRDFETALAYLAPEPSVD